MRSSLLCCAFFCLFPIIQGQTFDIEMYKDHYKCWTYMNCISDGPMARKMESCLEYLKPGELQSLLDHMETFRQEFNNQTVPEALKEFCSMDGDKQQNVYCKMVNALKGFVKNYCNMPDKGDFCPRSEKAMDCVYYYLKQNFPDDDCKID